MRRRGPSAGLSAEVAHEIEEERSLHDYASCGLSCLLYLPRSRALAKMPIEGVRATRDPNSHTSASSSTSSADHVQETTRNPESVAVTGATNYVRLAAVIQQTIGQLRGELPRAERRHIRPARVHFTGFVGINLLRRYCGLPDHPPAQLN